MYALCWAESFSGYCTPPFLRPYKEVNHEKYTHKSE